ncbi:acyltransferase family protein [Fictibacillus aquaticus]|uniref:acyltransferase family protein n=1 Tax=Fictibacillus aquaticus TaxID=2021314 RepID=UPI0013FDC6D9|nr:acyltransferase family protein [Fictibacillus aquaticus]
MERRYDLDWIKVLATGLVIFYHCTMFFNPWPWHVKNNDIDHSVILVLSLLIGSFIMPLFFAISGISLYFALQKRSIRVLLKERLLRLGIPLLFAVWVLSPPQVYIERFASGQFTGSFLQFLPHYTDGLYLDIGGSGNFSFAGHHLWYVLVLLVFSAVLVPLLIRTKNSSAAFKGYHLILLPVPLSLIKVLAPTIQLGGYDILFYLAVLLYGFYFLKDRTFTMVLEKYSTLLIAAASVSSVLWVTGFLQQWNVLLLAAVQVLYCWSSVLLIFHLANKHLSFSNSSLRYFNEASMPYYVLHQPIIVIAGFFLRGLDLSVALKFLLLACIAYGSVAALYHFAIKPYSLPRILTGLNGKSRKKHIKSTPEEVSLY